LVEETNEKELLKGKEKIQYTTQINEKNEVNFRVRVKDIESP
jgi:hypothetical protein